MCNKCGQTPKYPISFPQNHQIKNQQTIMAVNMLTGGIFSLINAINTNNSSYTEPVSAHRKESKVETPEENPENIETQENAVKNLIGETAFNGLSSELQEDLLLKYDVLKSVRKLDDEIIKERLNTYIQATQAGEKYVAVKTFVTSTLKESNVNYDESLINSIVEKHNLLELFDPANDDAKKKVLKQKIIDYANGTNYVKAEVGFDNGQSGSFTHRGIADAMNTKDGNVYKNAHLQFGQEMIEVYDVANPDGKIDFVEFAAYQAELNGIENATDDITEAARVLFNIQDMNSDGYIDQNEMSADLWTTATILDTVNTPNTSHQITKEEYDMTQLGKQAYGTIMLLTEYTEGWNELSAAERKTKLAEAYATLTEDEKAAYQKYAASRKNSIDAFLPEL